MAARHRTAAPAKAGPGAGDVATRPRGRPSGPTAVSERQDDGLTVVTESMPGVHSVTLGFWVGTGSVDEEGALWGASHFLEHLLFKGTDERSARSIAEDVDAVGGDMNAFTTKEYTAFYVRLLAGSVDLGLDILSDILWGPAFRSDELESERQVILEEILMHGDEPADLVHEVLAGTMWPDHPLGREVLGEERTITDMTRDQIAGFHARHYRPGNIVFAAAGDLDHDAICAALQERRRGVTGGETPPRRPAAPTLGRTAVLERPTEQAHLAIGVPGLARDDDRRHVLAILDHVLGGGMSSRLFQEIREHLGLAYSVYSYRLAYQGTGALSVYAGTNPDHAARVLDLIHAELDRMAAGGITQAELDAARGHVHGSLVLGLEDSGARMSRLGYNQLALGRVDTLEEVVARFAKVSVDDVGALAAELFGGGRSVAVVGPFSDDAVAERR